VRRASGAKYARRAVGAAAVVGLVVLVMSGGGYSHYVQLNVSEATGVIPGERVVSGGATVGEITSALVTPRYGARLVLGIDDSAWPIATDSVLTLRMGGTIKYTDRFIQLTRGHGSRVFANNAYIPARQLSVPVEYDQLFNIFDAPTRAGLRTFMDNGGQALHAAQTPFRAALADGAPAVIQADAVFRDLAGNQRALSTLVGASDQLVRAIDSSNPGLSQLLSGASNTFTAVGSQSRSLQTALQAAPMAFYHAGHALGHASATLGHLSVLARRLDPGVLQLRSLAAPLDAALTTVIAVEPDAVRTLDTIRTASPSLVSLLSVARTTLMPRLQSIGKQLARQVDCVRPYTPDIAGLLTAWTGFWGDGDYRDKVLRGELGADVMPGDVPLSSAQLGAVLPTLKIDYPQVPGMGVNQPWFQPQCGMTPNNLQLSHDSEAGTFDPLGGKLVPYTLLPK
jgi:ABC-type transporter Mla subunit MlaD